MNALRLVLGVIVACGCMLGTQVAFAHVPQARGVAVSADGTRVAVVLPGFGVLLRTRAGEPFAYLCDAAYEHGLSTWVPAAAFLSDGTLLLGTSDGIRRVSPDGCPAPLIAGSLSRTLVVALAVHAATDTAYAVTGGDLPALWRSKDGGKTWEKRTSPVDAELLDALVVSTDDADVVYLSLSDAKPSALLVSRDGGASFESVAQERVLTLLHASKDRLWSFARAADNTTNRGFELLRATAPEGPWTATQRVNYFGGFAIDARGVVWVGDESGGLHRSDDDGATFVDVGSEQAISCLAPAGDALFACAPGTHTMPALVQYDGDAFATLTTLAQVDHLVACTKPGVALRCESAWIEWRRDVRMESEFFPDAAVPLVDAGDADAGGDVGVTPEKREAHEPTCSVSHVVAHTQPSAWNAALLALALRLRARRRKLDP